MEKENNLKPESQSNTAQVSKNGQSTTCPIVVPKDQELPDSSINFHYDEFCDILGGIQTENLAVSYSKKYTSSYKEDDSNNSHGILNQPFQYFFTGDFSGLFPLEVLYLKTHAFIQLLKNTRQFWLKFKKPHLGISPQNITISLNSPAGPSPARWNFTVDLKGKSSTQPIDKDDLWVHKRLFKPGSIPDKSFASPSIMDSSFMSEHQLDSVITTIGKTDEGSKKNLELCMDFTTNKDANPAFFLKNDILHITLHCNDSDIDKLSYWASITASSSTGFQISAPLNTIDKNIIESLQKRLGSTFFNTSVKLYKSFHIPCDIYSLGKILLSTLLRNQNNTLLSIDEKTGHIVSLLNSYFKEKVPDTSVIKKQLISEFNINKDIFSRENILFSSDDYYKTKKNKRNKIPPEIWEEMLIIPFTLITQIEGFSLCTKEDDYLDFDNSPIHGLIKTMENFQQMISLELFKSKQQRKDILSVLNEPVLAS